MAYYICTKCRATVTSEKAMKKHKCPHSAVCDLMPPAIRTHRVPGDRKSSLEGQVGGAIELAFRRGYDKGWEDHKKRMHYHADY